MLRRGDKVQVKSYDEIHNKEWFVEEMRKYCCKTAIVEEDADENGFVTLLGFDDWWFNEDGLIVLDLIEKEIELINRIIFEAVIHGGDSGGPYYSNSYRLYRVMNKWLKEKELSDDYIITEKELKGYEERFICATILQIVRKGLAEPVDFNKDIEF